MISGRTPTTSARPAAFDTDEEHHVAGAYVVRAEDAAAHLARRVPLEEGPARGDRRRGR